MPSSLITYVTAETTMVVSLPEGPYAARAVLGTHAFVSDKPIVAITMEPGHAIPIEPDSTMPSYLAQRGTFNEALQDLHRAIANGRRGAPFMPPRPPALPFAREYPALGAPGWRLVRVRRLDGAITHVPAGTAILHAFEGPSPPMLVSLESSAARRFVLDATPQAIEEYRGRWVLCEWTPGAPELHTVWVDAETEGS